MLAQRSFPSFSAPSTRAAIVVDMVGDVDAMAAQSFAETAERLTPSARGRVVLNLRHAALLDAAGVTLLARTVLGLQRRGFSIDVLAESKRVRTALIAAQIASRLPAPIDRDAQDRHVMIVRNAAPARDCA